MSEIFEIFTKNLKEKNGVEVELEEDGDMEDETCLECGAELNAQGDCSRGCDDYEDDDNDDDDDDDEDEDDAFDDDDDDDEDE